MSLSMALWPPVSPEELTIQAAATLVRADANPIYTICVYE